MTDSIRTYPIGRLTVQTPLDEPTTRRLVEHLIRRKLLGRTAPPRKAFLGYVRTLFWDRRFEVDGVSYVVRGAGGMEISIFETEADPGSSGENEVGGRCRICELDHPADDLVPTPDGPVCGPCFATRFPVCTQCGQRVELDDHEIPAQDPFVCRECGG